MEGHLTAAHRILRYLKGKPTQGVFFPMTQRTQIKGYADLDWGNCTETKKSISGYCIFIESSLLSSKSKKQTTVSKSSSKAEYKAMAASTAEIQWLIYLLRDFGITSSTPALLFCDNTSAIHIAKMPYFMKEPSI